MADLVRIGVIGTGKRGLMFAAAWSYMDREEFILAGGPIELLESASKPTIPHINTVVTGCCGEKTDKVMYSAEQFSKAFGCKVYDCPEDMADASLFDGIFIANDEGTSEKLEEYAMIFIKAGIPVFVDCPFAADAACAARLLNAARENNTLITGGASLIYSHESRRLPKRHLGKTVMVYSTYFARLEDRFRSMQAVANLIGAVWAVNGEYEVTSVRYIGSEEGKNPDRKEGTGEVYHVMFKDGYIGVINCNEFGQDAYRQDYFGTEGVFTHCLTENQLRYSIVDFSHEFSKMAETKLAPRHYDRLFELTAIIDAGLKSRNEGGREVMISEIAEKAGYQQGIPMENRKTVDEFGWW